MSDTPWAARLSPKALAVLQELSEHAREMLRDVMDIAGRDPWSFPLFDSRAIEGEDARPRSDSSPPSTGSTALRGACTSSTSSGSADHSSLRVWPGWFVQ
ncbi:hypothetical protein [Streptomyces sp. NPDC058954]|uniref:hypothetical protein n=1 Tax=Streptomyces sp. NPDC058954 TaxID=3346677 RepID=UPI0036AC7D9E